MGKGWKNKYIQKHGQESGQAAQEVQVKEDYGVNVIEPCGTWKNPVDFGLCNIDEYGVCQLYFATRITTEENEFILEGWKTPEDKRVTVPLFFDQDEKRSFTGIYQTLGDKEIKLVIPVGKLPYNSALDLFYELFNPNLATNVTTEKLVERFSHRV